MQSAVNQVIDQKNQVTDTTSSTKSAISSLRSKHRKAMAGVEKVAEATSHAVAAVELFMGAESDLDYVEASINIMTAIMTFLPPPASILTEVVAGNILFLHTLYRRSQYYISTLVHKYVRKLFLLPFLW